MILADVGAVGLCGEGEEETRISFVLKALGTGGTWEGGRGGCMLHWPEVEVGLGAEVTGPGITCWV
jgi:hypothetical protein